MWYFFVWFTNLLHCMPLSTIFAQYGWYWANMAVLSQSVKYWVCHSCITVFPLSNVLGFVYCEIPCHIIDIAIALLKWNIMQVNWCPFEVANVYGITNKQINKRICEQIFVLQLYEPVYNSGSIFGNSLTAASEQQLKGALHVNFNQ